MHVLDLDNDGLVRLFPDLDVVFALMGRHHSDEAATQEWCG